MDVNLSMKIYDLKTIDLNPFHFIINKLIVVEKKQKKKAILLSFFFLSHNFYLEKFQR